MCRTCAKPISILYPALELLTVVLMTTLYLRVPHYYFFGYFIFFSALLITIRSDIETMYISRYVTIYLLPVGYALSAFGLLPLDYAQSIIGSLFGYFLLYTIENAFFWCTGKHGLGRGDAELLALVGAFCGMTGCWVTLCVSSIVGSVIGIAYLALTGASRTTRIPFGPFLALGACSFVLFQQELITLLFRV